MGCIFDGAQKAKMTNQYIYIYSYISSRPPASRGGDLLICSRAGTSGINSTGNIANMFDEIPQTFRIRVHHKDFLPAELIHTQF